MELRPRVFWSILIAVVAVMVGVVGNPLIITPPETMRALYLIAVAGAIPLFLLEFKTARLRSPPGPGDSTVSPKRLPSLNAILVLVLTFVCWLGIFRTRWEHPKIIGDDNHYLAYAETWPATRSALLVPYNEHLVVPTRLLTYALVQRGGDNLATAMAVSAIPLFALTYLQLFFLARRWLGSEVAGLVATMLFALTGVYSEIIVWYSATQWLFAFNLLLVNLNVAEWRNGRLGPIRLAVLFMTSFAAPFCYSIGVLVGPITAVWLAFDHREPQARVRWWQCLVPVAGTGLGVAATAPILLSWMRTQAYHEAGGRGAMQTFSPIGGIYYAARLLVEHLVLRNLGIFVAWQDPWFGPSVLAILLLAVVAFLRWQPRSWNSLAPALLVIVLAYAATMPFRTWVLFDTLRRWNRYELIPQLGLSLLLTAALRHTFPVATADAPTGKATWRQCLTLGLIALGLTWLRWRDVVH